MKEGRGRKGEEKEGRALIYIKQVQLCLWAQLSHARCPAPPPTSWKWDSCQWAFLLQDWVLGATQACWYWWQGVWALLHQRLAEHPGGSDTPLKVFQPFQWKREVSSRVLMRGHSTPSCLGEVPSHVVLLALPCSIHYGESGQLG